MRVAKGDLLVIRGRRVGEPDRAAEVLDLRGADGGPPYLVRWADNGHEGLFFPGGDVSVQPAVRPAG